MTTTTINKLIVLKVSGWTASDPLEGLHIRGIAHTKPGQIWLCVPETGADPRLPMHTIYKQVGRAKEPTFHGYTFALDLEAINVNTTTPWYDVHTAVEYEGLPSIVPRGTEPIEITHPEAIKIVSELLNL